MLEASAPDRLLALLRQTRWGMVAWVGVLVAAAVGVVLFQITHIAQYIAGDSFTYFAMARKFYDTGLLYSYSGLDHTTGVHPAYYFFTLALYPLFGMQLPEWSFVVNALLLSGGVYLCYRAFGLTVATVVSFFCLLAYGASATNNGMESALLFFVLSCIALVTARLSIARPIPRQLLLLGFLLGLAIFARLDTVFFVVAFGAFFAWRLVEGQLTLDRLRTAVPTLLWVGVPILAWLGVIFALNLHYDGTLVPLSGKLKSSFPHLKESFSLASVLVLKLFLVSVVVMGAYLARRLMQKKPLGVLVPALFFGTGVLFAYNALFASGIGAWYGTLPFFALALTAGLFVREATTALDYEAPTTVRYFFVVLALMVCVSAATHLRMSHKPDLITANREAAVYLQAHAPVGAAVGELNDGIFAFYGGDIPVYNLTGLGNNAFYATALHTGTLDEYFKERNILYIIGGDSGIQVPGAVETLSCTAPFYTERGIQLYKTEECAITRVVPR